MKTAKDTTGLITQDSIIVSELRFCLFDRFQFIRNISCIESAHFMKMPDVRDLDFDRAII